LHLLLEAHKDLLLNNPVASAISLAPNAEVHVYGNAPNRIAFLGNWGSTSVPVTWNNKNYTINAWSVLIVSDTQILFDTSLLTDDPNELVQEFQIFNQTSSPIQSKALNFQGFYSETAGLWGDTVRSTRPLEQLSVTHDKTDYLWYVQKVTIPGNGAMLNITYLRDIAALFVDNRYIGSSRGSGVFKIPSSLAGGRELQILSLSVGLDNYGPWLETIQKGILGSVLLDNTDITNSGWVMQPSVRGEFLQIYSPQNQNAVTWNTTLSAGVGRPLTWFKASFDLPTALTPAGVMPPPFALDMSGMNKGAVWVNGHHLGRYYLIIAGGDCSACSYIGNYDPGRCRSGCGEPSQQYYHVPPDWLKPKDNLVIIFEEFGGDPREVRFVELKF